MPATTESAAASTMMKVTVSGSLEVPIRLDLLNGLQDPVMEAEILKECARLSVSERLGHFSAMDVDVAFDPAGQRTCHVQLDLAQLGQCVEDIQGAYEHLLAHAQLLQALLDATETDVSEGDREAKMRMLVERMVAGPQSVVAAAAAAAGTSESRTTHVGADASDGGAGDKSGLRDDEELHSYRYSDPDRTAAGKGLLEHDGSDTEGEDDEAPVDYEALGYTRL